MSTARPKDPAEQLYAESVLRFIDTPSPQIDVLIVEDPVLIRHRYQNHHGNTLLHALIAQELTRSANYVIAKFSPSLNFDLRDNEGKTVFILATKCLKVSVIESLFRYGKEAFLKTLNAVDKDNRSALHYAYLLGLYDVADWILKTKQADINAEDRWGNTPRALMRSSEAIMTATLETVGIDAERSRHAFMNNLLSLRQFPMALCMKQEKFKKLNMVMSRFSGDGILISSEALKNNKKLIPILFCHQNRKELYGLIHGLVEDKSNPVTISPEAKAELLGRYEEAYRLIKNDDGSVLDACIEGRNKLIANYHAMMASVSAATAKAAFFAEESKSDSDLLSPKELTNNPENNDGSIKIHRPTPLK